MQQVLVSAIAVIGALLGATATYFLQRKITERAHAEGRKEQRRKELVEALVAYGSAVMSLRRVEYDRWNRRNESADGITPLDTRMEAYRLRAEARSALFHVRLLVDPDSQGELVKHAESALELAKNASKASSVEELSKRGEDARLALERVIDLANRLLRSSH